MDVHEKSANDAKALLRRSYLARRLAVPPEVRAARDAAMVKHLAAWLQAHPYTTVCLFWPFRGEPDLTALAGSLPTLRLALPAIAAPSSAPAAERSMAFWRWRRGDKLVANRFGILEPATRLPSDAVKADAKTLVLAPALAVDGQGVRLGYGGGYYDRFLNASSAGSMGVVDAESFEAQLPTLAHDRRVGFVLTETGVTPVSPR